MRINNRIKNLILMPFNILYKINPELNLRILFWLKQGYKLNLINPTTYNEKIQWIKLYDKNPLMPQCCDKYAVRDYVTKQGCEEILNGLLWEGNKAEDISFDTLPDKFVIKVTHGSTFNIICTDKSKLDKQDVINKCRRWMKMKFLPCYGEWFYGIVKPRIIVEEYLESTDGESLKDYKVFCFGGKAELIRVDSDRFTNHSKLLYDVEWNLQEGVTMGYPLTEKGIDKPECLDELIKYAEKLSAPFLHARVDFYIVKNQIIFGEITFSNGAGFDRIRPYSFDEKMGGYMKLPADN